MPAPILHLGATITCMHAGLAAPLTPFPRVLVSGQLIATLTTSYAITGCALTGTPNPPCVTAQWVLGAAAASPEVAATAQFLIQGALQQWLSDVITVEAVEVEAHDGALLITVQYVARLSQQRGVAEIAEPGGAVLWNAVAAIVAASRS